MKRGDCYGNIVSSYICNFVFSIYNKMKAFNPRTGGYVMNLFISFVVIGVPFLITAAIIEMFLKDMKM